jgi:hypothetical protein
MRKVRIFLKSAFFTDDRLVLLGLVTSDHDNRITIRKADHDKKSVNYRKNGARGLIIVIAVYPTVAIRSASSTENTSYSENSAVK